MEQLGTFYENENGAKDLFRTSADDLVRCWQKFQVSHWVLSAVFHVVCLLQVSPPHLLSGATSPCSDKPESPSVAVKLPLL